MTLCPWARHFWIRASAKRLNVICNSRVATQEFTLCGTQYDDINVAKFLLCMYVSWRSAATVVQILQTKTVKYILFLQEGSYIDVDLNLREQPLAVIAPIVAFLFSLNLILYD